MNIKQTLLRWMVFSRCMKGWNKKIRMRLPALLLLCITVLFWSLYDRYEAIGPVILTSPEIEDATRTQGDYTGSGGRFALRVAEDGRRAQINFRMSGANDYQRLRIRARMKLEGVERGKYYWSCGRLLLLQYDENERWMSGEHGIVAERGTKDWEGYEDVFDIFPAAAHIDVVLQNNGRSGTVTFDQIEVQPVSFRNSFWWWQGLFLILWLGTSVLYFPRCRLNSRKLHLLIILNVIVILAGTLTPGAWISTHTEWIKDAFAKSQSIAVRKEIGDTEPTGSGASNVEHFNVAIDHAHEVGHVALFASLCFLVYLSAALERQHPIYFAKVGIDVMLFAGITESLQFLTLDRTAGVGDLLLDIYGMATALLLFICVLPLVRRYQEKIP